MSEPKDKRANPPHPWRLCPLGEHWVRTHLRRLQATDGEGARVTEVEGHCRKNPSGREILVPDEIHEIARLRIPEVSSFPADDDLGFGSVGNDYDDYIGLWTQFWNEVLQPDSSLTPNHVKALVAQESGFDSGSNAENRLKGVGNAKGLIQITEQTRKILGDHKGELKDYLVDLDKKDLLDPNLNLAAGIRWLFHKRNLLSQRLKRSVTWEEAVLEYKGITDQIGKNTKADKIKLKYEEYLERLNRPKAK